MREEYDFSDTIQNPYVTPANTTITIRPDTPNADTLEALEEVRQMKQNPQLGKTYTNVDAMMKGLLG